MRVAVFVLERDRCQRAAAKPDLRSLNIAGQRVGAVAADLLLVNQLDRGPWREVVEIMAVRERVLQRLDDWLGDPVLGGRLLEVVLDLEGHFDWANVVLNRP